MLRWLLNVPSLRPRLVLFTIWRSVHRDARLPALPRKTYPDGHLGSRARTSSRIRREPMTAREQGPGACPDLVSSAAGTALRICVRGRWSSSGRFALELPNGPTTPCSFAIPIYAPWSLRDFSAACAADWACSTFGSAFRKRFTTAKISTTDVPGPAAEPQLRTEMSEQ